MLMFITSVIQACQKAGIEEKFFKVLGRHSLTIEKHHSASLYSFCHSTLCVSAVFAVAWCVCVRLSVCLSVTLVHCIHAAEDIVKFLCQPGSSIILVFLTSNTLVPNSKIQGGGTILQFSTEVSVYLG